MDHALFKLEAIANCKKYIGEFQFHFRYNQIANFNPTKKTHNSLDEKQIQPQTIEDPMYICST